MTTVLSSLFVSLDGVAEVDPDWHFPYFDEHMSAAVSHDYEGTDVMVLGRVTYDSFAEAWPAREEAGDVDAPFAKQLGDTRKVVATRGATSWVGAMCLRPTMCSARSRLCAPSRA